MKKVIVVSDTHRQNENYFKVLEMHKPDMVIHCGDVEGSEYALTEAADCPVHMVAGNNDFFSDLPKELELSVDGYQVLVTHGHHYYVSTNTSITFNLSKKTFFVCSIFYIITFPTNTNANNLFIVNQFFRYTLASDNPFIITNTHWIVCYFKQNISNSLRKKS